MIVAFIGVVTIVPSLIAYALGLFFSLDLTILRDTFGLLLFSIAYGLVIAVCSGTMMLAMSSLSRNSRYVGLVWLGFWIISGMTSYILSRAAESQLVHEQYVVRRSVNHEELVAKQLEASKTDWRPLVSYTQNLSRVGGQLLGVNACWDKLSELQPPGGQRQQFLLSVKGNQFPWYWSAGVLAGLFGLSVCILNFRIKSLDRLK